MAASLSWLQTGCGSPPLATHAPATQSSAWPPPGYREKSYADYLKADRLAAEVLQEPAIYDHLPAEVAEALRDLNENGLPMNTYIRENRPVYFRDEEGRWAEVYPSNEMIAWRRIHMRALQDLGVEVEWRNDLLLYVVKREP